MQDRAAILLSAFDAHEMTMDEFAEAVRFATPELVQLIAVLFSNASLILFQDEERRRSARLLASGIAWLNLSMN